MLRPLIVITWCMTGVTVLLVLAETVTGMLLMHYYRQTIESYNEMLALRDDPMLGILRELHLRCSDPLCLALLVTLLLAGVVLFLKLRKRSEAVRS
jgi:uncharacterized protein with PQ loop repeat